MVQGGSFISDPVFLQQLDGLRYLSGSSYRDAARDAFSTLLNRTGQALDRDAYHHLATTVIPSLLEQLFSSKYGGIDMRFMLGRLLELEIHSAVTSISGAGSPLLTPPAGPPIPTVPTGRGDATSTGAMGSPLRPVTPPVLTAFGTHHRPRVSHQSPPRPGTSPLLTAFGTHHRRRLDHQPVTPHAGSLPVFGTVPDSLISSKADAQVAQLRKSGNSIVSINRKSSPTERSSQQKQIQQVMELATGTTALDTLSLVDQQEAILTLYRIVSNHVDVDTMTAFSTLIQTEIFTSYSEYWATLCDYVWNTVSDKLDSQRILDESLDVKEVLSRKGIIPIGDVQSILSALYASGKDLKDTSTHFLKFVPRENPIWSQLYNFFQEVEYTTASRDFMLSQGEVRKQLWLELSQTLLRSIHSWNQLLPTPEPPRSSINALTPSDKQYRKRGASSSPILDEGTHRSGRKKGKRDKQLRPRDDRSNLSERGKQHRPRDDRPDPPRDFPRAKPFVYTDSSGKKVENPDLAQFVTLTNDQRNNFRKVSTVNGKPILFLVPEAKYKKALKKLEKRTPTTPTPDTVVSSDSE